MVEVGTLEIGGTINTQDLEKGLARIRQGFDLIDSKAGGVNADFERMAKTGKTLNKFFIGMAVAGGAAMFAIAKGAPAVAASMAQIKVETGKLQRSLGRGLAPIFDLAADAFSGFVDIIQNNEGIISGLSTVFSEEIRGNWADGVTILGALKDKIFELGAAIGINEDSFTKMFGPFGLPTQLGKFGIGIGPGSFPDPIAAIAELIRANKGVDKKETRRSIGQILQDWF